MKMRTTIHHLCSDIWQEIFHYFNAIEVINGLIYVTDAANAVVFNLCCHCFLRGLVLDACTRNFPKNLLFTQVISLELHQESCFNDFHLCSEVRSLKLVGDSQWAIDLLAKVSYGMLKLEQLTLIVPGIGLLHNFLASISPLLSLRRLAIYAEHLEERIKSGASFFKETKIEQFILRSCSSVSCNDLLSMCPSLNNIRFLDITLFHVNKDLIFSFSFPKLRSISLILIEIPFDWIIGLVERALSVLKLKLSGLVNAEGFVVNDKWLNLFQSCPSLITVIVSVSLEQDTTSPYNATIQKHLREISLDLKCIDEDGEYYSDERNQCRWWNLSGNVIKRHKYIGEKYRKFCN
ncbi:hypothetical protein I4U23_005719 [Adineta vaga]|nr:hypothetical protein I4U23_005719 [Adineta vaga]